MQEAISRSSCLDRSHPADDSHCIDILILQCLKEFVEGLVGVLALVKEGNKLRADDSTSGIALGGLKCLLIADAKANHAGIAQIHGIDTAEILLLGIVERLLSTGNGG